MGFFKPYIENIAQEFWQQTGGDNNPPFDIGRAISLLLPVTIITLPDLSIQKVESWLNENKVNFSANVCDRKLHGFILVVSGMGFIFINGTDMESERRFTLAHEVSHFILDYLFPRNKAMSKMGDNIASVLDGEREATIQEKVNGLLKGVNMKTYTHLVEKTGDGAFTDYTILKAENNADSLALELLAPSKEVIRKIKHSITKPRFHDFVSVGNNILTDIYGLPRTIAQNYAQQLGYFVTKGPSLMHKIGF